MTEMPKRRVVVQFDARSIIVAAVVLLGPDAGTALDSEQTLSSRAVPSMS